MKKRLLVRLYLGRGRGGKKQTRVKFYDTVICQECGREFKFLGRHVPSVHGISGKEYRKKYPGFKLCGDDGLEFRREMAKVNLKKGIIGTKESLEKAHKAQQQWVKENPKEVREQAIYAQSKVTGNYWSEENRNKKAEWMKKEARERWKKPEFRKKMAPNLEKFLTMRQLAHHNLSSLSKICVFCGNKYHPHVRDSKTRFMKKIFCTQLCRSKYQRKWGLSFSAWGKVAPQLLIRANETLT